MNKIYATLISIVLVAGLLWGTHHHGYNQGAASVKAEDAKIVTQTLYQWDGVQTFIASAALSSNLRLTTEMQEVTAHQKETAHALDLAIQAVALPVDCRYDDQRVRSANAALRGARKGAR